MGEIKYFGPGKIRRYPYPVCKKRESQASFQIILSYARLAEHKT